MNLNDEKLENALMSALELKERRKSTPEILALFPAYREEIRDIVEISDAILLEKEQVLPQKEMLTAIIERIPAIVPGVTKLELSRYVYQSGYTKGRSSTNRGIPHTPDRASAEYRSNETPMHNAIWKFVLPAGAVAIIAVIVLTGRFMGKQTIALIDADEINGARGAFDESSGIMDQYLDEETAVDEVDGALGESVSDVSKGAPSGQKPSVSSKDPFGFAAIQSESKAVGSDSDLNTFSAEEAVNAEVDSTLADF